MPKPIAVFDIDGTIFRSSLIQEINLAMIEYGLFPKVVREEIAEHYQAWVNRKGSYDDYIERLVDIFHRRLLGVSELDLKLVTRLVLTEHKDRVYVYTRELVKKLRRTHTLVAISGAHQTALDAFTAYWKFDYAYGSELVFDHGIFQGKFGKIPFHNKKKTLLDCVKEHRLTLKKSIGVGDTESDIPFLEEVERPIAFNPNKELYDVAQKRGWEIIVERKNVVYHLNNGLRNR